MPWRALLGRIQRGRKLFRMLAAGLGHVGLAAAAPADDFGRGRESIGRRASPRCSRSRLMPATSVTLSASRLPSSTAIGLAFLAQLVDQLPHQAGVGAGRFGHHDRARRRSCWRAASSFSAETSPARSGPDESCFFSSRTSLARAATRAGTSAGGHLEQRRPLSASAASVFCSAFCSGGAGQAP